MLPSEGNIAVITPQAAETIAKSWTRLDWENIQIRLEEEVKAIGIRQDEADEGRKLLLNESADFREKVDKTLRKAALPLIKAFQAEVDRLTARSKAAETLIIDLCRALTQVSDPSPYLEQFGSLLEKSKKLQSCEEELVLLKSQVADLQSEYADLQNQELTVRKLREQIKTLEAEARNNVQLALSDSEKQLRAEFDALKEEMNKKQEEAIAENKKLTTALADLEVKNRETNRCLEEAKLKLEQKATMEDEQMEIISADLENALRRAEEAEIEVARLKDELSKLTGGTAGSQDSTIGESALIRAKDNQIRKLLEENKMLSAKLAEQTNEARVRIDELTQELERHAELVDKLETQVRAQADYEDIKKELRILRSVEFGEEANWPNEAEDSGVTSSATATAEVHLGGRLKALDELLVEKNRKLQSEAVALRMRNQEMEGGEGDGTAAAACGNLQSVADALGLIVGANNETGEANVDWSHDQLFSGKECSGDDDANSETQCCAASLLNLLMCTASSSTASMPASEGSASTDDDYCRTSFNIHEAPRTPAEAKIVDELQARVAHNVRKLNSRPLNTMEIARQCKRLMVAYNIGQRLFAKFVMNQSQGSLSELLSKPRHWNKLTDKGREAFRRIYGWISDEKAIELLCSVSPRRIQPAGDVKIEAPPPESLWENGTSLTTLPRYQLDVGARGADENLHKRSQKGADETSKSRGLSNSTTPNVNSTPRSSSRWRHDDIPKEKIITIFQNELAKLREQESHLEQAIASRPPCTSSGGLRAKEDKKTSTSSLKKLEEIAEMPSSGSSLSTLANAALNSAAVGISSKDAAHSLFAVKCRSGMSPITQEQLERYAVLDTEEVVRQIKEYLCANSISQRQFGEHVLGLSQGSVSDLLARPKQWNLLTQKGREPFIRMKLFLNEAALLSTKVKDETVNESSQKSSMGPSPLAACEIKREEVDLESHQAAVEGLLKMKDSTLEEELEEEEDVPSMERVEDSNKKSGESRQDSLDTAKVVELVKDRLHSHGVSQKTFGDIVLGVGPGGASELLSKPKEWDTLSVLGREPYLKMNTWLSDPEGICQVQKAATGSSTNADETPSPASSPKTVPKKKRSLAATSDSAEPPRKAQRTVITEQQKEALKFVFAHDQHPSQRTVEQLSEKLALNSRTVSNWFHNYRTRQKASLKEGKLRNFEAHQKRTSTKSSDRWQQDLAELLEMTSKPLPKNQWSPTMVAGANTHKPTRQENEKLGGNSQLDKAIARMQLLAAAKQL